MGRVRTGQITDRDCRKHRRPRGKNLALPLQLVASQGNIAANMSLETAGVRKGLSTVQESFDMFKVKRILEPWCAETFTSLCTEFLNRICGESAGRGWFVGRRNWRRITGLLITLGIVGIVPGRAQPEKSTSALPRYLNTAPGVKYVGSGTCWYCHYNIYQDFRKTAMGRSMTLPSDPRNLAKVPHPITVHDQTFDRSFQIMRKGSNLYQSEYQLDAQGKEVFKNSHKITYIIGAGENGLGGVVRQGNYLVEAPLSYYTKQKKWELSPGYKYRDFGFTRALRAGCTSCHSGRPEPVHDGHGLYRDPPFSELAIGCENCHGPGQLHVAARSKGVPLKGRIDPTIVNPAHLPGWLADNICMRCHQWGDARILQPGKTYSDFRPGTPLNNTLAIFLVPFNRNSPPRDPLLQHYILMILSKCYRATGGRLHCITCHDPHVQPTAAEAPKYFRAKCMKCHTEKSCTLPLKTRLAKTPPDNCIGCHMPKQNVRDISHSALTNHRIVAYPGEPFPNKAFHMTTPQLPDLVHLNAVPGKASVPVPRLTLLKAYGEIKGSRPQYGPTYDALLDIAAQTNPNDPYVLAALGRREAMKGTPHSTAQAIQLLSRAIKAGWTETPDYALLSELLARSGHLSEGVAILKQGIKVNPYDGGLYRMLVVQDAELHRYQDALETIKQGLKLFPQDSILQDMQKKAESTSPP